MEYDSNLLSYTLYGSCDQSWKENRSTQQYLSTMAISSDHWLTIVHLIDLYSFIYTIIGKGENKVQVMLSFFFSFDSLP